MKFPLDRVTTTTLAAASLVLSFSVSALGAPRYKAAPGLRKTQPASLKIKQDAAYEFVNILIPASDVADVIPIDINNRGTVSGIYTDTSGGIHSFIWRDGRTTIIDYPGALITSVATITDSGILFGNWGSLKEQHAGYYNLSTGEWTQLPDITGYPILIGQKATESGDAIGYRLQRRLVCYI